MKFGFLKDGRLSRRGSCVPATRHDASTPSQAPGETDKERGEGRGGVLARIFHLKDPTPPGAAIEEGNQAPVIQAT